MKVLLIEDEKEMALTIGEGLGRFFTVEVAFSAKEGDYQAQVNEYDVILLDYLLPDMDGIELCRKMRGNGIQTPILMVTGNFETKNKVAALNSGIDDYITKPFSFEELRARMHAVLRRAPQTFVSNTLPIADLTLDLDKKTVERGKKSLSLRRKEFDLLEYLVRNAGKVVTRNMILEHVWDSAYESATNAVDVHIKYLRDQIDKPFEKKLIKTVHGVGYKIEA